MIVVSDINRGNLIEVINSHKQENIIEFLRQQPIEVRERVKEVSVDMWGGFPKVVDTFREQSRKRLYDSVNFNGQIETHN